MVKTIPTKYNGISYRSRLEARWAYLFDCVGVNFFYEPEGFVLSDGTYYLPDFYVPGEYFSEGKEIPGIWVECKGLVDSTSIRKPKLFSSDVGPIVLASMPGDDLHVAVKGCFYKAVLAHCDCHCSFSEEAYLEGECRFCYAEIENAITPEIQSKVNSYRFW